MAQNFVAQLPIVSIADLVYGNQCGICREDYGTNIAGSDIVAEDAVRLPCGHEFGFECLSSWLSPNGGRNSCPNCRHVLFPTAPNINNGFAQLLRVNIQDDDSDVAASVASVHSSLSTIHSRLSTIHSRLSAMHSRLTTSALPSRSVDELHPRLSADDDEALFQELRGRRVLPAPGSGDRWPRNGRSGIL